MAAFVWWAFFPEPAPFSDQLMWALEPMVMWAASRDVHSAEGLLGFLQVWCYVAVLLLFALAGARVLRRMIVVSAR